MVTASLPDDGEVRLGPVALPAGRRHRTSEEPGAGPVAWVTDKRVPDAGRLWWALSDLHAQTGLVPFLEADWVGIGGEFPFFSSFDVAELEHLSAADVLSDLWPGPSSYPADDREQGVPDSPDDAAWRLPFGLEFPGLARGEEARLSHDVLAAAVDSWGDAHIGLAVAARPADVLPVIGWMATDMEQPDALEMAAVLRSWEDRFGARLLQLGSGGEMWLLVERPPRTVDAALALAAEHLAFSHESQDGSRSVRELAAALAGAPTWRLWWD